MNKMNSSLNLENVKEGKQDTVLFMIGKQWSRFWMRFKKVIIEGLLWLVI